MFRLWAESSRGKREGALYGGEFAKLRFELEFCQRQNSLCGQIFLDGSEYYERERVRENAENSYTG
jgi:hypothetical protein